MFRVIPIAFSMAARCPKLLTGRNSVIPEQFLIKSPVKLTYSIFPFLWDKTGRETRQAYLLYHKAGKDTTLIERLFCLQIAGMIFKHAIIYRKNPAEISKRSRNPRQGTHTFLLLRKKVHIFVTVHFEASSFFILHICS